MTEAGPDRDSNHFKFSFDHHARDEMIDGALMDQLVGSCIYHEALIDETLAITLCYCKTGIGKDGSRRLAIYLAVQLYIPEGNRCR